MWIVKRDQIAKAYHWSPLSFRIGRFVLAAGLAVIYWIQQFPAAIQVSFLFSFVCLLLLKQELDIYTAY